MDLNNLQDEAGIISELEARAIVEDLPKLLNKKVNRDLQREQ